MLNSFLNFLIKKPAWSLALFLMVICSALLQIQNFSLDEKNLLFSKTAMETYNLNKNNLYN
jgi:hypothetical protein